MLRLSQATSQGVIALCAEITTSMQCSPETGFLTAPALIDNQEDVV